MAENGIVSHYNIIIYQSWETLYLFCLIPTDSGKLSSGFRSYNFDLLNEINEQHTVVWKNR